jgi:coatomer subunit beta'
MSPAGSLESSKLLELDLHPLELHFPFKPNKLIKCPLTLTNKTDHHIGFWITPTSSYALHYYFRSLRSPTFKMVEPHSTLVVTVTLRDLLVPPSQDRGKFEVSMVAMGVRAAPQKSEVGAIHWQQAENGQQLCEAS